MDLLLIWVVVLANTYFSHIVPIHGMGCAGILNRLFKTDDLGEKEFGTSFEDFGLSLALVLFFFARFALTACSLKLPVPNGCVSPSLVLGAIVGRMAASYLGLDAEESVWLSIVGATCFAASVLHSFSIVVAVFELLAMPGLILPLSIYTLVALFVAVHVAPSIFDAISRAKGLPYIGSVDFDSNMQAKVEEVMLDPKNYCVPSKLSPTRLAKFAKEFQEMPNKPDQLGIVDRHSSGDVLVGAIAAHGLDKLCESIVSIDPDSVVEVLHTAAENDLVEPVIQVYPGMTLAHAYNTCLAPSMGNSLLFVVQSGRVLGVVTENEIFARRSK